MRKSVRSKNKERESVYGGGGGGGGRKAIYVARSRYYLIGKQMSDKEGNRTSSLPVLQEGVRLQKGSSSIFSVWSQFEPWQHQPAIFLWEYW